MDPFSTGSAALGVAEAILRLSKWLYRTFEGAGKVNQEIETLQQDLNALVPIYKALDSLRNTELAEDHLQTQSKLFKSEAECTLHVKGLWAAVDDTTGQCWVTITQLEEIFKAIIPENDPSLEKVSQGKSFSAKMSEKFANLKKELKRQGRESQYEKLRGQLQSYHSTLNTTLIALNIIATLSSKDDITKQLDEFGFQLKWLIASHASMMGGLNNSAKAVASELSLNKHFAVRAVSSVYTGREKELRTLQQAIYNSRPSNTSKSKQFVVYGLGGSGKTEFCLKFAGENRENFWGIFNIDATSKATIEQSLASIAEIARCQPNERAVRHWFSSLAVPWLLIIDNADDPLIPIDNYLADNPKGCILITSRNPSLRTLGTLNPGSYQFEGLEIEEAQRLLLTASGAPQPWPVTSLEAADRIVLKLGSLALALVHAAKSILSNECTLSTYVKHFDLEIKKVRYENSIRSRLKQSKHSDETVFASWEMLYAPLERTIETDEVARDAADLLRVFAFFDCNNIRVDYLEKAVKYARMELQQQKNPTPKSETFPPPRAKTWRQMLKQLGMTILGEVFKDRGRPVLPAVLQDSHTTSYADAEIDGLMSVRLNKAVAKLTSMSLVTVADRVHQKATSFNIHPLVHFWVRQRPQMRLRDQAIWCQAAATILAQCVLIPPTGPAGTKEQDKFEMSLHPHMAHVEDCQKLILAEYEHKRNTLRFKRNFPHKDRKWALQSVKFSLVYLKCGDFKAAERLQVAVRDWLLPLLGPEHEGSRRITLLLALTLWHQTRINEAAILQRQVFEACKESLGDTHPETLEVMISLGRSLTFQSRLNEAKHCLETAIQGLAKVYGEDSPKTLTARDALGTVFWRYFEFEKARDQHVKAIAGLRRIGEATAETLVAKENLAMTYMEIGRVLKEERPPTKPEKEALEEAAEVLNKALELIHEVLRERKEQLGNDNPYTLLAIDELARVKSVMGDGIEAEQIMREGLPHAERTLGEDHFGTLAGHCHYAQILIRLGRLEQAEAELRRVTEASRYKNAARDDGETIDRIFACSELIRCLQQQCKWAEALQECIDLQSAVERIGGEKLGTKHVFWSRLEERRRKLEAFRDQDIAAQDSREARKDSKISLGPGSPVENPSTNILRERVAYGKENDY